MSTQRRGKKRGEPSRFALERVLRLGIVATVVTLPLLFWPGFTDYNYTKSIASLVLISVLLVLWGLTVWRRASWTIRIPWLLVPTLGIVLAGVLSMIGATNARVAVQSLVLLIYFVLLLLMIANVVRNERDVRWLLIALLVSGSLAALYGVLQYFGVVAGKSGATGVEAILSTMGNRNHLGGFLLYLFYPAIILVLRSKPRWAKAATLVLIIFAFAVMLLVRQAGTQLAFVLTAAALIVGWLIFRPAAAIRANRTWLLALVAVVIVIWAGWIFLVPPETPSISSADREQPWLIRLWEANSGQERSWFWWIGLDMLAENPITGAGLGNYKVDFFTSKVSFAATDRGQAFDHPIKRVSQAHSELVQTGAELGSIGLLMLICSLATLAVSLWIRLKRSNENDRLDLLLLTAGILAFLVHSIVSFPAHVVGSSLGFVVICGLALSGAYGQSSSFTWVLNGWKGKTTHVAIVIIASVISLFALADLRANWLMERGLAQVQAGLYAAGESTLQRSLGLDFAPRQTFFYLALAQVQLGRLDDAEENLEKCLTRFLDAGVYATYAEVEANRGELDKAQVAVTAVLATHPQEAIEQKARYIEAVIAVQEREFDHALQLLESLTQDHPSYETGFVALGQLYAAQKLTNSARSNFDAALRLIDGKLREANDELEAGTVVTMTEYEQIRARVDRLTQQREYVVDQLNSLL